MNLYYERRLKPARANRTTMNQSTFTDQIFNRFLIATIFLSGPLLLAGPEAYDTSKEAPPPPAVQPWCETPAPLEIRIGIPGWMAGLSGDTGVKGVVSSVDVSFDQLLRHLTHVPIVLSADIRYHRWELFGDGQYMEVGASATLPGLLFTNANVHLKSGLAEAFLGYRLINCDKASLALFDGARYSYLSGELEFFDNGEARLPVLRVLLGLPDRSEASGSIHWVYPEVGVHDTLYM